MKLLDLLGKAYVSSLTFTSTSLYITSLDLHVKSSVFDLHNLNPLDSKVYFHTSDLELVLTLPCISWIKTMTSITYTPWHLSILISLCQLIYHQIKENRNEPMVDPWCKHLYMYSIKIYNIFINFHNLIIISKLYQS